MNLKDFVRVYDDVIKPEHCALIIDKYEQNQKHVQVHDTELYKFHQLDLNHTPELIGLAEACVGSLYPRFEHYFDSLGLKQYVHIDTFEDVRIKKYLKGSTEEFKTHVDVADKDSAARFCVAILYLNDNNGYTTFPNLNIAVAPKAGRVVMFPPTWMFPHNGLTPSDNDKYIMMTCLHYK
jgi:hypothetical protein